MSGESRTCARSRASLRRAVKALLLRRVGSVRKGKSEIQGKLTLRLAVYDLLHKRKYLFSKFKIN